MQFKVDENLPNALVALLSEYGHDAATVREEALNGRPDVEIAARCKVERRAIVTLDLDFSDITALPPEEYAGIIVLRIGDQSKRRIMQIFEGLMPLLTSEPLDGNLWIVEDGRVRIWRRW